MFFRFCVYCNMQTLWAFVKQIVTKDGKLTDWDKYTCSVCEKMSFVKVREEYDLRRSR